MADGGSSSIEPELGRPSRSLAGRCAIITGAGAHGDLIGNARATAIMLAEDGCSVVCVDLDLASAQRTVDMIKREGKGDGVAVQANIVDARECEKVVRTAVETFGRVDILFNCVGIGGAPGTAVDVDMDAWARGMEVNVSTMVLMAKHTIPEMKKNSADKGYRGVIVNMGSSAALRGGNPALLYPTSKAAVLGMTKAMAFQHAKDGIRVNCICPGLVYSPMMYAKGMDPAMRASRKNRSPMKIEGNPWDTGAAVRWLSSDDARWVTALVMEVDGGLTSAVETELAPNQVAGG